MNTAILNGENPRATGKVVHIVRRDVEQYNVDPALCGRTPGRRSTGWVGVSHPATCRRCRAVAQSIEKELVRIAVKGLTEGRRGTL